MDTSLVLFSVNSTSASDALKSKPASTLTGSDPLLAMLAVQFASQQKTNESLTAAVSKSAQVIAELRNEMNSKVELPPRRRRSEI